ncbi:MAG: hypothetical protein JW801_13555 [Bacteroidales bacterium]|nr:hypothetical protein [Bacteroidales bacterium]
MRTSIRIIGGLALLIAFACGGKDTAKKPTVEQPKEAALELAGEICQCIDSIKLDPAEGIAYELAVKRCFEDKAFELSRNKEAGVSIRELWNATEKECPDNYTLYEQIQD